MWPFASRDSESNSANSVGRGGEPHVQQLGTALLDEMGRQRRRLGHVRQAAAQRLMDWAMSDPEFKTQLFRFVDVFPTLRDSRQVHETLVEYLSQPGVKLPPGLAWGLKAGGVLSASLAQLVTHNIERLAANFIGGHEVVTALPQLKRQWQQNVAFSVDVLGEACLSDAEADQYLERYQTLLTTLADATQDWPANERLERDYWGPLPRVNVSVKLSSLSAHLKPEDHAGSVARLFDRLRPLLQLAEKRHVFVNFDMEQSAYKELTIDLFRRCCEQVDFPAGLAMQAYLKSGPQDAADLIAWARASGRQVTVRLIKGAYWDQEVIQAELAGWPVPVWTQKEQTDACFESMARQFVAALPQTAGDGGVKLALGSHNVRSIAATQAALSAADFPPSALEYQLLQGMADDLRGALVTQGSRVRTYIPLGEVIPGMAYLVRRLLENTSNESWLRGSTATTEVTKLLRPPKPWQPSTEPAPRDKQAERHRLSDAVASLDGGRRFLNEPLRDFSDAHQRSSFARAVNDFVLPTASPDVTLAQLEHAVHAAAAAAPQWAARSPLERAACMHRAAGIFRHDRDELAALVMAESGKPWREADADVCEAIDFCEFYARQAVMLGASQPIGHFVGEQNRLVHGPLGVAAIISPWNFPLAIVTGMTVAALVTGNAALVKPAEQTPRCAERLCATLWKCGVPRDALHFVPGAGETIGAALVDSPAVDLIGFTGSRNVGLQILERAGRLRAGQRHVKRVICEMGGKNAIIVDATADMDEAVAGVCRSAFGYAGQKCSAASRVIVLRADHDRFLGRLVEMTRSLVIGDPRSPSTDLGPVIDHAAADRIRAAIAAGRQTARLCYAGTVPEALQQPSSPAYLAPHIFDDVSPSDPLAQEEIFGPVLAVITVDTFTEALDVANQTNYKLTGAVYSRTPSHLELARQRFDVGNLYLNRGSTGALVGRQPFGGFGHSGTGTKAGGTAYLSHFVVAKTVCENTLRRGFAPSDSEGV